MWKLLQIEGVSQTSCYQSCGVMISVWHISGFMIQVCVCVCVCARLECGWINLLKPIGYMMHEQV